MLPHSALKASITVSFNMLFSTQSILTSSSIFHHISSCSQVQYSWMKWQLLMVKSLLLMLALMAAGALRRPASSGVQEWIELSGGIHRHKHIPLGDTLAIETDGKQFLGVWNMEIDRNWVKKQCRSCLRLGCFTFIIAIKDGQQGKAPWIVGSFSFGPGPMGTWDWAIAWSFLSNQEC